MKVKLQFVRIIVLICLITISSQMISNAQVFSGLASFSRLIEYEGQRYLMEEIYQITTNDFDKLEIDKTIKEVDNNEGFMFVLTSYVFNGKSGVVITSLNSVDFSNTKHQFVNVHLTDKQFKELVNTFNTLGKKRGDYYGHILRKFDDRLIVDVHFSSQLFYTLWVDYYSRHTFTKAKWEKAFKRYEKFIMK